MSSGVQCFPRLTDFDGIETKTSSEVLCLLSESLLVSEKVQKALKNEQIDGISLLCLNANDVDSLEKKYGWLLGEKKRFMIFLGLGSQCCTVVHSRASFCQPNAQRDRQNYDQDSPVLLDNRPKYRSNSLKPDFFKTAVSLGIVVSGCLFKFIIQYL